MSSRFKRNNPIIAYSNRCVETYALYAQVLNDQQVKTCWFIYKCVIQLLCNVYLCGCSCQEFDRADALYQQGMKVDPGNANLLVRKLRWLDLWWDQLYIWWWAFWYYTSTHKVHRGLVALQSKGDVNLAVELISQVRRQSGQQFTFHTLMNSSLLTGH